MKRHIISSLMVAAISFAGCSDDEKKKDGGNVQYLDQGTVVTPDLPQIQEDAMVGDSGVPLCGPEVFPCGPYGYMLNDIAKNLEFVGYADPEEHCKEHKLKQLDVVNRQKVSFKNYFQGGDCATPKKKVLWVMVSAGWCGPCQEEVEATQGQYAAGNVDPRMGIINIVFETDRPGDPVTDLFIKKWINAFDLTFPTVMDPSFKMGEYFDKAYTPFNMLIDLETMQIFHQQTGGDLSNIGKAAENFLAKQ